MNRMSHLITLGVLAGILLAASGCGDTDPYSARAIASAQDPVGVILVGMSQTWRNASHTERAARAVAWLSTEQKHEFLSRGGLTSLVRAALVDARNSHEPLRAAAALLASVPAEAALQRLRGEDAQALYFLSSRMHGDRAFSSSPAWSAFVSSLPPAARADFVLNVASYASSAPTGSAREAWLEEMLATAATADLSVLVPGLVDRMGPSTGSDRSSRTSPETVVFCAEVLGSLGTLAEEAAVPLFALWKRASRESSSSPLDPMLSTQMQIADAAWTALIATNTKGGGFGLFLAEEVHRDRTLLLHRRVVRALYEAGRISDLNTLAGKCLDDISPWTYAMLLAEKYQDSLPSRSVPVTLNEGQQNLARLLCMEVARLDHAGWTVHVVNRGSFRDFGAPLEQLLDPQTLNPLNRQPPELDALSSRNLGRLALATADHVRQSISPSESALMSLLASLSDYDELDLADLFISALDVPLDKIQIISLRWMQSALGPQRATGAFFENFRNRKEYSRSQIDLHISVLAELNRDEMGRHVAHSLLNAIEHAGGPDEVSWASKYIAIRTLERVGDARAIPTLRLFEPDTTSFVEIEETRETAVRFAQITQTTIATIESRGP